MAASDQLTQQLELTNKLRENVESIRDSAKEVTDAYGTQLKVIKQLVDALNTLKPKETQEQYKQLNEAAQEAEKNIKTGSDAGSSSMKKLGINVAELDKKFGKTTRTITYTTAALSGFKQGFKNLMALSKSLLGFLSSVSVGLLKIGTSIISIPFKMFKGLIDMSQQGAGDMLELLQEIENVRKQFGQLGQPSAKAIFDTTKTLGGFAETGLNAWQVFGFLHERMQFVRELAEKMGVAWSHMVNNVNMKEEGGHILAYMKGLGLAAEQMKTLYDRSVVTGKQITQLGVEMTKYSYAMAKQFGLSAKEISRDVGKAITDVKHFGQLTVKEINVAATYARKLNIEFEKIVGTLDAFETFDTAAENAAKLAQSFGMNVDAFKMMEAQNPADQFDMLRKAMFAAGKDSDKLNRQELKLLATSVGLDEATAKTAFAFKNQGVSLDEIKKKANITENAQMKQAEAMKTLAGAIERMIKSGMLDRMTGFFDAFVKGMLAGVRASPQFLKLMINIRWALRQTWWQGFELGRKLIDLIPGLKEFFVTLQTIFDPKKYLANARRVRKLFEEFFVNMTTGPFSFAKLMDSLRDNFFNFFNTMSPEGQKVLNSMKKMLLKMGDIAGEMITYFSKHITKGITLLADFVRNPQGTIDKLSKGGKGASAFVAAMLDPIIKSITAAWPALRDALLKLYTAAFDQVKDFLRSDTFASIVKTVAPAVVGIVAGPVVTKTLTIGIIDLLTKALFKGVEQVFEKGALEKLSRFAGSRLGQAVGVGTGIAAIVAVSLAVSSGMKKFRSQIVGEFTEAQKDVAAGATGIVDALTLGLMPDWLLVSIANYGAKLGAAMQASLNNVLTGFGDNVMGYLQGYMKFFGGIGDVIFGIFKGDTDRITSGLWNILVGGFQMIVRGIQFQMMTLPKLIGKLVIHTLSSVMSTVQHGVGKMFDAIGLEGIGKIFHGLGDTTKQMGRIVIGVFDLMSSAVSRAIGFITDLFDSASEASNSSIVKIAKSIASIVIKLTPLYWILKGFSYAIIELWKAAVPVIENVAHTFKGVWKFYLKPTFDAIASEIDAFAEKLTYAADFIEKLSSSLSVSEAVAHASRKRAERLTAHGSLKDVAKQVVSAGKDAIAEEAKREGGIFDPLLDMKNIDVKTAPSQAINFARDAVDRVDDIKKRLESLAPEKLEPIVNNVKKIFEPGGTFMNFIEYVNTGLSGTALSQAASSLSSVSTVFESFNKITSSVGGIEKLGASIDSFTRVFSSVNMSARLDGLNSAFDWIDAYGATMTAIKASIEANGIVPALAAVQKMVNAANDLDKALSDGNIAKMNVKMKLQNVAKSVGLGGKANYEIKNRGVNVHIDLKVEINAADMEKALIMRGKSIVRNRLENAEYTRQSSVGDQRKIPEKVDESAPDAYFVHPT